LLLTGHVIHCTLPRMSEQQKRVVVLQFENANEYQTSKSNLFYSNMFYISTKFGGGQSRLNLTLWFELGLIEFRKEMFAFKKSVAPHKRLSNFSTLQSSYKVCLKGK